MNAIVLAGGRASRVGGAAKPLFEVGGRTLLERAVEAMTDAGCLPIVVVGPVPPPPGSLAVQEDPPFGGPVAGIVAALPLVDPEASWTLVIGADLPAARAAVTRVTTALPLIGDDIDGVCLGDPSSRPQWLIGAYRTRVLEAAASALPNAGRDARVAALVADLAITVLTAPADEVADIDTWADLSAARERMGG